MLTPRWTSLPRALPSQRTAVTRRGWTRRLISRRMVRSRIMARDTFRPPAVDPAQPPINISANKIARDSPGQTLKSAVA